MQLAIFVSGSGTNAANIIKTFSDDANINVAIVISNRADAPALEKARALGVSAIHIPTRQIKDDPQSVVDILRQNHIDLVVLAGFMVQVPDPIIDAYPNAIINIHPSLLPTYGGKGMWGHHVHEAVIADRQTVSGDTVHIVTSELDKGEIIMQQQIDVASDDTPETLQAKVHTVEYELFPRAIRRWIELYAN
jgi:phosphoribosylglycinamide formyltransferase-1